MTDVSGSAKLGLHLGVTTIISQAAAAVCFLITTCQALSEMPVKSRILLWPYVEAAPPADSDLGAAPCRGASIQAVVLPFRPALLQTDSTGVQTSWLRQHLTVALPWNKSNLTLSHLCCRLSAVAGPACHSIVSPLEQYQYHTCLPLLQTQRRGQHLAVVDEEGYVSVINTAQQLPTSTGSLAVSGPRPAAHWVAHNNAIFDVKWCQVSGVHATPPFAGANSAAGRRRLLGGAASRQPVRASGALLPQRALRAAMREHFFRVRGPQ